MADFRQKIEAAQRERIVKATTNKDKNVCCGAPMIIRGSTTICGICDAIAIFEPHSTQTTTISKSYLAVKGVKYNMQQDYPITQKETIRAELSALQSAYFDANHTRFPDTVLNKVVDLYNQIQQYETRRGRIKDEILATLIYYECINESANRRRKDVSAFMGIPSGGFSRGDNIVKTLMAESIIQINISDETIVGYIDRYLEILSINTPTILNYDAAIIEIIERAINFGINTKSMISSKVIGAIWFIIVRRRFTISQKNLEAAVDGTKRNTFLPFYNDIICKKEVFADIIERYDL